MFLSDKEILRLIKNNSDFIKPFAEKNLQSSSYDVSLSSKFKF